jgi:hypothetical protein
MSLGMVYVNSGRLEDADRVVAVVKGILARRGLRFEAHTALVLVGQAAFALAFRGDLQCAVALAEPARQPDLAQVIATKAWASVAAYAAEATGRCSGAWRAPRPRRLIRSRP